MRNYLAALLMILSLQGCIFAAGAAAGAAGIAVVYDHRKIEKILLDNGIANQIDKQISASPQFEGSHINVTCFNQVVLLTGEAMTADQRVFAEDVAKNTKDVTRVYNQITVKGPSSSLSRASDTWITTKIKTQMLATKDLQSGTIKVVTENGSVYLLGIVTRDQADMAVDIARQVSGVQRVVKMFQYKD